MPGSFWRQFAALCKKNYILLWRAKWINLVRCLLMPVAYAAFFSQAQNFFAYIGVFGPGSIQALQPIPPTFRGYKFVYSLSPTNTTHAQLGEDLLQRVFSDSGIISAGGRIQKVDTLRAIDRACPANYASRSDCWLGVQMYDVDPASQRLNYTLRGNLGLININVDDPAKDDIASRYLPMQWAIDSHFINMSTGVMPPTPGIWEYTNVSNASFQATNRLCIRDLIVLAFFIVFVGVVYQLPGGMAYERSSLLTSHLEAMGCRRSARIISWHVSMCGLYVPAWILVAVIWQKTIFTGTPIGLFIVLYIITGLNVASWSQLVVVFFKNSSTLAAIMTTFFCVLLAILALVIKGNPITQTVLTFVFPPMFFIYYTRALTSWERFGYNPGFNGLNLLRRSPERDTPIAWLMIVAVVDIFLFPLISAYLEHKLYGVRSPDYVGHVRRFFRRGHPVGSGAAPLHDGIAVEVENLRKVYSSRKFGIGKKTDVVAIDDLSFSGEIFALLGRNGAAKSTSLHIIARLLSATRGRVRFAPDLHLGLASQKDVLWEGLSCMQHVELWRNIKQTDTSRQTETDAELLQQCDLGAKLHNTATTLSGGMRRRLVFACALAGGSNLLLLDECTSGLDPLARRAIWKMIAKFRGRASIIFTTHFLDEADYLSDTIAILQQPGKLLALDNPVSLKTRIGKGFVLSVDTPNHSPENPDNSLSLATLFNDSPADIIERNAKGKKLFFTGSSDYHLIRKLVAQLDGKRSQGRDIRYQVNSASLEQVFLDLNADSGDVDEAVGANSARGGMRQSQGTDILPIVEAEGSHESSITAGDEIKPVPSLSRLDSEEVEDAKVDEKDLPVEGHIVPAYPPTHRQTDELVLTPGRKRSYLLSIPIDASTIFLKRWIVLRRQWILTLVGLVAVILGAILPLPFMKERVQTCSIDTNLRRLQRLSYPFSFNARLFTQPAVAPQSALGTSANIVAPFVDLQQDNTSWVNYFDSPLGYINNTLGGVSIPGSVSDTPATMAFEATVLTTKGQTMLNMMSNAILNQLVPPNITGIGLNQLDRIFRINTDLRYLGSPSFVSTAIGMKWIAFFGLAVGVWPAFAVIYPTQERQSSARANQYSNGATPAALWLGHIVFELPFITVVSIIITVLLGTMSSQFSALGYVWICMWLYGIAATLFGYFFALFLDSALASFALSVGVNVVYFMLYLAAYLLILTYDQSVNSVQHMTIMHYTTSIAHPVPSIVRAILVSINMFNLLCDGQGNYSSAPLSSIGQFGGPILYLVLQILFAFAVLVYVDSGAPVPAFLQRGRIRGTADRAQIADKGEDVLQELNADVLAEKARVAGSSDMLRVVNLSKRYHGAPKGQLAVDDVTFGTQLGESFALIGPNGAGKTTCFATIRGVEQPSGGDVFVSDHSVIHHRNLARAEQGVCPQFNAIDTHLTVKQHLWLYGRLKHIPRKLVQHDIDVLLAAAGLTHKADHLATSLSGGNVRKLSLLMALIGDRPLVLIDEFSSGVDSFSKREAWRTLEKLTKKRAVVLTTHSMEEVEALASRVGVIASRMLAVGTPASLKARFATYEIHLQAAAVEQALDYLVERGFDTAERSRDTGTRISITGVREPQLGRLLEVLEGLRQHLGVDVTLHEASTENAFLTIIRQHNVLEEQGKRTGGPPWYKRMLGRGT